MRNRYSPEFKAKVVREVLREDKTLSQVSAKERKQTGDFMTRMPYLGLCGAIVMRPGKSKPPMTPTQCRLAREMLYP